MRRLLISIVLFGACGSPASDEAATSSKSSATKEHKAAKAAKAAKDLDDQLIAPPADVVAGIGAEVYPGAKMLKAVTSARSEVRGIVSIDYIFFVPDAPTKVRDFYEGKLANATRGDAMMEKMGAYVVKGTNTNGEAVVIQARGIGAKTTFHFIVTKK